MMKIIIVACVLVPTIALSRNSGSVQQNSEDLIAQEQQGTDGSAEHKPSSRTRKTWAKAAAQRKEAEWQCEPDPARVQAATEDLSSCFKYYSSCMSLWQNNINMLQSNILSSYCMEAYVHNLPAAERDTARDAQFDYIHDTASPYLVSLFQAAEAENARNGQLQGKRKKLYMGSLVEESPWKKPSMNSKMSSQQVDARLDEIISNFTQMLPEHNEADNMLSLLQRAKGGFMIKLEDLAKEDIHAGVFKVKHEQQQQASHRRRNTGSEKLKTSLGGVSPTR